MITEEDFAGRQQVGGRKNQQDYYAFVELGGSGGAAPGLLLAVADGMGGYRGGEHASKVAVHTFIDAYQSNVGQISSRFAAGLDAANQAIKSEILANPAELESMGTTLLAALVHAAGIEWISVGDSALYLLRGGELHRLNADHSMRAVLQEQVAKGELSAQEAATHPSRTKLLSALIGERIALVDCSSEPTSLQAGDLVVAATDGLETLQKATIAKTLERLKNRSAAEIAVATLREVTAEDRPKQDNTTVAVIKISASLLKTFSAWTTNAPSLRDDTPTRSVAP